MKANKNKDEADKSSHRVRKSELKSDIKSVTFEVEMTKETAEGLRWLCWNAGLSYPSGIGTLIEGLIAEKRGNGGK